MDVENPELRTIQEELSADRDLPPGVERWSGDLKFVEWIEKDGRFTTFLTSSLMDLKSRVVRLKLTISACLAAPVAGTVLAAVTGDGGWMVTLFFLFLAGGIYLRGEFRAKNAWANMLRAFVEARFIERYELSFRDLGETDVDAETPVQFDHVGSAEPVEYFALSEKGILMVRDGDDYFFDQAIFYEVRPSIPLYETVRPWRIEELTRQNMFEPRQMTSPEQQEVLKQILMAVTLPAVFTIAGPPVAIWTDYQLIAKMGDKYEPSGAVVLIFLIFGASLIRFGLKATALQPLWRDRSNRIVCTRFEDGVTYEWLKESKLPWSIDGEPVPWRTKFPFPI